MEIVFTRAENACGYERPLDEQLHTVEHRGGEKKKEKERGEREKKGKCVCYISSLMEIVRFANRRSG